MYGVVFVNRWLKTRSMWMEVKLCLLTPQACSPSGMKVEGLENRLFQTRTPNTSFTNKSTVVLLSKLGKAGTHFAKINCPWIGSSRTRWRWSQHLHIWLASVVMKCFRTAKSFATSNGRYADTERRNGSDWERLIDVVPGRERHCLFDDTKKIIYRSWAK